MDKEEFEREFNKLAEGHHNITLSTTSGFRYETNRYDIFDDENVEIWLIDELCDCYDNDTMLFRFDEIDKLEAED